MVLGRASSAMLVVGSASVLPGVMRCCEGLLARLWAARALIASVFQLALNFCALVLA